tara:strand:- start:2439 stop:3131 length:693 start_codon:yes stop_codon:yes gene_type:complete
MVTIEKSTIKRLLSDIKQIKREPLEDSGIYYKHDESNMLKGYAMIIGPENTPYQYGFYFFEIEFPLNYPHSPPKFTFRTGDNVTRFNPNFYRSGKCCVSILNTWKGEQWTSCQTLSSILLTIQSLFNDKPLLNEPGIKEDNPDFYEYNNIITYKNFEVAIVETVYFKDKYIFNLFTNEINNIFKKNKSKINDILEKKSKIGDVKFMSTTLYKMKTLVDYPTLYNSFKKLK